MKLSNVITDKVNIVEAYFCPEELNKDTNVINTSWEKLPNIPSKSFKNRTDYHITEYNYKNMSYIYDTSTDSQKVVQRVCVNDTINKNVYIIAIQEETLPSHSFPCTNDINSIESYYRITYKFNNRIFFHIEKDEKENYQLYLRYSHAFNVDIEKMNEEWNEIYNAIEKCIYRK